MCLVSLACLRAVLTARCERYGGGTAAQPERIRCLRSEMEGGWEREREREIYPHIHTGSCGAPDRVRANRVSERRRGREGDKRLRGWER